MKDSQFTSPLLGITAIKYADIDQVVLGSSMHMQGFELEALVNELEALTGWATSLLNERKTMSSEGESTL